MRGRLVLFLFTMCNFSTLSPNLLQEKPLHSHYVIHKIYEPPTHILHTQIKAELTFTFVTETFVIVYFKVTEIFNAMVHDNLISNL